MAGPDVNRENLLAEIERLRTRLTEAEETIRRLEGDGASSSWPCALLAGTLPAIPGLEPAPICEAFRTSLDPHLGFFVTDPEGKAVFANSRWLEFTGVAEEDFPGSNWTGGVHPEDRDDVAAKWERMLRKGGRWGQEFRLTGNAGRINTVKGMVTRIQSEAGETVAFTGVFLDVTEKARAQSLLHDQGTMLAILLNAPLDTISLISTDRRILNINGEGARRLGAPVRELIGRVVDDYFPPEVAAERRKKVDHVVRTGEPLFFDDEREGMILHNSLYPVRDRHGTVNSVAVFARDVTEQRRAEEEVRRQKETAERYLDVAGVMLIALDDEERVTLINQKGCEILGGSREQILGENWFDRFIPAENRETVRTIYREILAGELEPNLRAEDRIVRLDGEVRTIAWRNALLRGDDGTITGTLSSGEDVTERRKAEVSLLESEERFRTLFEGSPIAVLLQKPDGALRAANPAACELFGYEPEEWSGLNAADLTDDAGRRITANLVDTPRLERPFRIEMNGRRKDGSLFPMEVRSFRAEVSGKETVFVFLHSIADRREAERQLRESEELHRTLMEHAGPGIGLWDPDGRCILMNRQAAASMGGNPEDFPGKTFHDLFPEEGAEEYVARIRKAAESGGVDSYEDHVDLPTGRKWFLSTYAAVTGDGGEPRGVQIISNDVTDFRRQEEAIRRSERLLDETGRIARIGGWEHDLVTGEAVWTRPLYEILGFDPEGPIPGPEEHLRYYPPGDREALAEAYDRSVREGTPFDLELRADKPTGDRIWTRVVGEPLFEKGRCVKMRGVFQDITRKKEGEEARRASEEKFRALSDRSSVGVYVIIDGKLVYANPALAEVFGYTPEEMTSGLAVRDVIQREQWEEAEREILLRLTGKQDRGNLYFRGIRKDGAVVELDISGSPVPWGDRTALMGTVVDVTERLVAERALQESERRFRTIFEHAADAMVIHDLETGRFLEVNREAVERYGYDREELRRMSPADLDGDQDRTKTGERLEELRARGRSQFETMHHRKDGTPVPTEVSARVVDFGGVKRLFTINRDITERKRAEEAIRIALEEIKRLKELVEAENVVLREEVRHIRKQGEIIGRSEAIQSVLSQAEQVATTDSTVLLLGETGTGKELLARAIHDMSGRKEKSMVVVNCAAIPRELVESELFGHEKGAFTGAVSRRTGRVEVANGSTLFLDEVGDLPLEAQAKLLRVLQEGRFEKVGSDRTIEVDVRIVAATNHDLEKDVAEKLFREDLFYRLNVFPILLPPLRDRKTDIEMLAWTFVGDLTERMGKRIEAITPESLEAIRAYSWPGNVRELRNVMERAVIRATGPVLAIDIPGERQAGPARTRTLAEMEREHIREVMDLCGWRVRGDGGAAGILDMKPTTLEARMKKLEIRRPGK